MFFLVAAVLEALLGSSSAAGPPRCSANVPLSCHNSSVVHDTCCFIPTGQLLQTQFWDSDPPTGPDDSWTVHGLWPDNCDGSYPTHCDTRRAYTNISDIMAAAAPETLDFMQTYWKDYQGDDETFWEHEWGKHGTCISTLKPSCYDDYQPGEEAVAYFERTVAVFQTLPTYKWLAAAGITPSGSRTYPLRDLHAALERQHGAAVSLNCKGSTLSEVWYHFNVKGSLQDGAFVAAEPDGTKGECPDRVHYAPKD